MTPRRIDYVYRSKAFQCWCAVLKRDRWPFTEITTISGKTKREALCNAREWMALWQPTSSA